MKQLIDVHYPNLSADFVAAEAQRRARIPSFTFPLVREWSYGMCVDVIPTRYWRGEFQFLLARRKERPWAGCWFAAGGRVIPGEVPEDALVRNCKRELGFVFAPSDRTFLLWESVYNPECEHGGNPYFTLCGCFQVWFPCDQEIVLDSTQSEYGWFTPSDVARLELSPYMQHAVASLRREPRKDTTLEWE